MLFFILFFCLKFRAYSRKALNIISFENYLNTTREERHKYKRSFKEY